MIMFIHVCFSLFTLQEMINNSLIFCHSLFQNVIGVIFVSEQLCLYVCLFLLFMFVKFKFKFISLHVCLLIYSSFFLHSFIHSCLFSFIHVCFHSFIYVCLFLFYPLVSKAKLAPKSEYFL